MGQESTELQTTKKHRLRGLITTLALVSIVAIGTSAFFYHKYKGAQNNDQAQQKQLLVNIAKVVQLPNSTPTIVTVADKSKLTNKVLASRVQNKDMLIIYDSSQRIIVYRPSIQKVIDMLTFEPQASGVQPKS